MATFGCLHLGADLETCYSARREDPREDRIGVGSRERGERRGRIRTGGKDRKGDEEVYKEKWGEECECVRKGKGKYHFDCNISTNYF
jgi:hypothetical protein